MAELLALLILVLPPAIPFGLTVVNLLWWPRGQAILPPAGQPGPRVSVLVPARNEEARIEACIESIFSAGWPVHEVLVYDDASTDRTGEIVAGLRSRHPALRVVQGVGLPDGWVGKPHACHRLSRAATGDLLLFVDADVILEPDGLPRLLDLARRPGPHGRCPDLVTAVPRQLSGSLAEALMMPLLHLSYTAWLPLVLIPWTGDPRLLAANGQVLMVRRQALERAGGWAAVRQEIVDDMALCRRVKQTGGQVLFADGHRIARCRMYGSGQALWQGFSKNLYEGIGGRPQALLGVLMLHTLCLLLPWPVLGLALVGATPQLLWPAAAGVGLNLLTRLLLALRLSHRPLSVLLHPLAVLGLLGIALNSFAWSRRGRIHWAGRTYAARAERSAS